jgi:hypothetical protein
MPKVFARSRIGNGKALLHGINTHRREYREFRDIVAGLCEHMGTDPSVVERHLAEEAASLIYWCRRARLALLTGSEEFNVQMYTTASNSLRRLLADIGQAPRLKNVTPTLEAYLRESAPDVDDRAHERASPDAATEYDTAGED